MSPIAAKKLAAQITLTPSPVGRFDDRVISLYARGLTVREIQGHLAEIYGTEVSPDLISKITDTVLSDAKAWQNRPLERVYPIVYLDALIVKIRDGHTVRNQACYVALGVNLDGERDVLGLWFQQTEGAKFWLHVLTDLKTRGVADILFVCVDGLTGFPDAIEATFPHATVQTCLVHQVRSASGTLISRLASEHESIWRAISRSSSAISASRNSTWRMHPSTVSASSTGSSSCRSH